MTKEQLRIVFYCTRCGNSNQDTLVDKEKSNKNWSVKKEICPQCGGSISFKINE